MLSEANDFAKTLNSETKIILGQPKMVNDVPFLLFEIVVDQKLEEFCRVKLVACKTNGFRVFKVDFPPKITFL